MADVIQIKVSEASSAVKRIKGKANDAQTTVNQLNTDVQNVKSWWKGDSSVAFVDEFSKFKKEFDKMIECVNKYGDLLAKAIDIQQKADEEIARQMRQ